MRGFGVWIDGEFHRVDRGALGTAIVKLAEELRRLARNSWSSIRRRNLHNKPETCRPVAFGMSGTTCSWKTDQKGERMRFQNTIRTRLVIAGLGTVLLFAGVTKGQEISNTAFDDGPNAAPFAEPVPAQGTGNSFSALPSAQATTAKAAIDRPVTAQQTSDEQERSTILIWIGAVLVWIGAIGLYARGPAKHLTRELRFLRDSHTSAPGD